jgi:hypothetical protein
MGEDDGSGCAAFAFAASTGFKITPIRPVVYKVFKIVLYRACGQPKVVRGVPPVLLDGMGAAIAHSTGTARGGGMDGNLAGKTAYGQGAGRKPSRFLPRVRETFEMPKGKSKAGI